MVFSPSFCDSSESFLVDEFEKDEFENDVLADSSELHKLVQQTIVLILFCFLLVV